MARKAGSVREQSLLWGVIAEISLGGTAWIWFSLSGSGDRLPFGRTGSIAIMTVAAAITLLDILALILRADSAIVRRSLVFLTAVGAGLVAASASTGIAVDPAGPWILMVLGTAGMWLVTRGLSRHSTTASR